MQDILLSQLTKRRIIILVCVILLGAFIYVLVTTSFIKVVTSDGSSASFTLTNQASSQAKYINNAAEGKKRVSNGSYEVVASSKKGNYFTVVKTKGFFRTTTVQATLKGERSRSFVGDNPGGCIDEVSGTLLTYACHGYYKDVYAHVPATSTAPTYTLTSTNDLDKSKTIANIIYLNGESWALTSLPQSLDIENPAYVPGYSLSRINADLSLGSSVALPDISPGKTYTALAYKQGFLVYSSDFSDVLYYSSPYANPTKLNIPLIDDTGYVPLSANAYGSTITFAYSHSENDSEVRNTETRYKTSIMVYDGSVSKRYNFDNEFSSVVPCAEHTLCAVDDRLHAYDISGKNPKETFQVLNVINLVNLNKHVIGITKQGALDLDIATRTGSFDYTFGSSYIYCGFGQSPDGYVLCVNNGQGNTTSALDINLTQSDTDNIDKKIASLASLPEIDTLSIYRNSIYVTAKAPTIYNSATQSYGPDPAILKQSNKKISDQIDKLGINRNTYTILTPDN